MDQRTICLYLSRKGFSTHVIHEELVQLLGPDAIAYSTITYHLRASRWTAQTEERHSDPPPDVVDSAILEALDQSPFASVRCFEQPSRRSRSQMMNPSSSTIPMNRCGSQREISFLRALNNQSTPKSSECRFFGL
jgi:hypothetical protein